MTRQLNARIHSQSRKGAATVVFLMLLYVIVVLGVFASDFAYMKLTKTELRIAVDACASGIRRIWEIQGFGSGHHCGPGHGRSLYGRHNPILD